MYIINWAQSDWAYLLGVVHGDGSIAPRSVSISVGYMDADYADYLVSMWVALGFDPKTYRGRTALRIDVHSKALRDVFSPFKQRGIWSWPDGLDVAAYLAGVFDTDGCVPTPDSKRLVIVLKRSGNLSRLVPMLSSLGIREASARDTATNYKGAKYETETITLSGMDRVVAFSSAVRLRNPRKAARLLEMRRLVDSKLAHVPLWRKVGIWLQAEPRTWEEIASEFGLTKRQVDSVLDNIRKNASVQTIPPPKVLSRFRVSGL